MQQTLFVEQELTTCELWASFRCLCPLGGWWRDAGLQLPSTLRTSSLVHKYCPSEVFYWLPTHSQSAPAKIRVARSRHKLRIPHRHKGHTHFSGRTDGVPCSALKPCSGTRELPVTNCRRRARRSSSYSVTARQNHFTMFVSAEQCFSRVCAFQSSMSILPRPLIINCKKRKLSRDKNEDSWEGVNLESKSTFWLFIVVLVMASLRQFTEQGFTNRRKDARN